MCAHPKHDVSKDSHKVDVSKKSFCEMKTAQKDKDVFKLQTSKSLSKSFDDFQSNKVKFTML